MKVKELIDKLKEFDPELPVSFPDYEKHIWDEVSRVVCKEDFMGFTGSAVNELQKAKFIGVL